METTKHTNLLNEVKETLKKAVNEAVNNYGGRETDLRESIIYLAHALEWLKENGKPFDLYFDMFTKGIVIQTYYGNNNIQVRYNGAIRLYVNNNSPRILRTRNEIHNELKSCVLQQGKTADLDVKMIDIDNFDISEIWN